MREVPTPINNPDIWNMQVINLEKLKQVRNQHYKIVILFTWIKIYRIEII